MIENQVKVLSIPPIFLWIQNKTEMRIGLLFFSPQGPNIHQTLNIEKTNYIIFRPRQKTTPFHSNIKIINNNSITTQPLEMKNIVIYLV